MVFPEWGGPKTHTLQGGRGKWGARKGRGFRKKCASASPVDITYSLSKKLKVKIK